jgi:hypothetical protein
LGFDKLSLMVRDLLRQMETQSMRRLSNTFFLLICFGLFAESPSGYAAGDGATKVDFTRDIKPILSNVCYRCHGPDSAERKGGTDGVRFDTADGLFADIAGHVPVVPGNPAASEILKRVTTTDPDQIMPPNGHGKPLTPREVELLTAWIQQGAKFSRHWSYIVPVRPELPVVKETAWVKNPIDRFILARLEREGLKPSVEADRYALIRRVSLDVTGLPPTMEDVNAFVNDTDPQAYEKLVDRILAKQAYGEHWGLLWLDLARYADSAGYADDPARKIWLFRDYVVKSFNANKPFDQFTIEQIAGDLLPTPTDDQLIATAFHRNTMTNNEGGTNDEEFRNVAVADRVTTTMAVWMGTTMTCSQCHNHKYDPITQEEFYRLFAFFNNTEDADRGDESPLHSIYTEEQKNQKEKLQAEVASLERTLKTETPELKAAQAKWDSAFPRTVAWLPLKPENAKSQAESAVTVADDGSIHVAAGAKNDTYTIDLSGSTSSLRALRLEAIPDAKLPGNGPGHAGGNFVVTKVSAIVTPPAGSSIPGRYIRVELPGDKYLSLAEVQVFEGSENVAIKGEAKQISTDFGGDAKLAIDGNTNGQYFEAKSTTHTAAGKDPWWEVDLKSDRKIDRIAIWNRTDGAGDRLANYRIAVLNEKRETIWQTGVTASPNPNAEFSVDGQRTIEFVTAVADYSQAGFEANNVLLNKDPKTKGWAIGGAIGQRHSLTLIAKQVVEIPQGATIKVMIEQGSNHALHTLGHFQFSATNDAHAEDWARTPANVLDALNVAPTDRMSTQQSLITQHYLSLAPELAGSRQQLAAVQKSLNDQKPETVPVMKEMNANRRVTKLQHRGNFQDLGKEVTEGIPAAFSPLPAEAPTNRLTLAKWLVDPSNPLTARVIANRYWEQLFGIGIVSTSEEFGSQGDLPSHPELLDWLACELAGLPNADATWKTQAPWDTKAFLKTVVMSAAYRQSSKVSEELQQRDPDNRLMARGPRFRMSAETLRDQALAVSGLLSSKMYGPPVKPPQPNLGLSAAFGSSTDWQTSAGEDKYRRGLYTTWRRSNPYPSMATFDAPNREVCTVRRVRTNTPLQALVTLNDPVYIEAAQALARRVVKEGGSTNADRARYGFQLVLARPPHENELARMVNLFDRSLSRFNSSAEDAMRMATEPLGPVEKDANVAELAAWTVVGNVLLNLDETMMKR